VSRLDKYKFLGHNPTDYIYYYNSAILSRGQEFIEGCFFSTFLCSLLSIFRFVSTSCLKSAGGIITTIEIIPLSRILYFIFLSMFSPSNNNNVVLTIHYDIIITYHCRYGEPCRALQTNKFLLVDVHVGKLIDRLAYALSIGL